MKMSKKAALLSGLVFPGLGHYVLKKYLVGVVLASTVCAGLYVLLAHTVERAQQIVDKIQSGEIAADAATIMEMATMQAESADASSVDIATAAIIVAWVIAIVDSYRVGRALDEKESAQDNNGTEP